jgi:hypothetical protein
MTEDHVLVLDLNSNPVPMSVGEMVVEDTLQTGRYLVQVSLDWLVVSTML